MANSRDACTFGPYVLLLAALSLGAQVAVASAQAPAGEDRFASRWVAARTLARDELLRLAGDSDAVNRQLAMLQLSEGDPRSQDVDALIQGLGDSVERVRLQATAGLMRLGSVATPSLIRALEDLEVRGNVSYRSEAGNSDRRVPFRRADYAVGALLYATGLDTEAVLKAYAAAPADPPQPVAEPRRSPAGDDDTPRRVPSYRQRLLLILRQGRLALVPALVDALASKDEALALLAAERIGQFGDEAASVVPRLASAAANHGSDRVRQAAADALTTTGPDGAAALRRLLTVEEPRSRRAALAVLPLGDRDAGAVIAAALKDGVPSVRRTALERIVGTWSTYLCDRARDSDRMSRRNEVQRARQFLQSLPASLLTDLQALAGDAEPEVRGSAMGALTAFACGHPEAGTAVGDRLARALDDRVSDVQQRARAALWRLSLSGSYPSAAWLPTLLTHLDRQEGEDHEHLLRVVGGVDFPDNERASTIDHLLTSCASTKGSSCGELAGSLQAHPRSEEVALSQLLARLRTTARTDEAFYELLEQLESDRPVYRTNLEQLVSARRDWVQLRAALQMATRGWTSPEVLGVLSAAVRRFDGYAGSAGEAGDALAAMGDAGAARLIAVVDDPTLPARTRRNLVFYCLGRAVKHSRQAADWTLAAAAGNRPVEIQEAALSSVDDIEGRSDEVQRVLETALRSSSIAVRRAAMRAWKDSTLPASDAVTRALSDPDGDVREAAVAVASRLPGPAKLEAMRLALRDTVDDVREKGVDLAATLGTSGADLLAEYIRRQPAITYNTLRSLAPLRPFTAALVAALQQKSESADANMRVAIDATIARGVGALGDLDRAPFRARLDNADARTRSSAAQVLASLQEDVWTGDGRLFAVLTDAQVMEIVVERVGVALDALYPPGFMLTSGRIPQLPAFPWPPPAGYTGLAINRSVLSLGPQPTVGDVYTSLQQALSQASTGFTQGLFGAPGGFALVARMERISADGTPLPGRARWMTEGTPTLSFTEFLGDLFFERPGYFRVIAFVLTDDPNTRSDPSARLPLPEEGGLSLPTELAQQRLEKQELLALVYSFERRGNAQIQPWQSGAPSPREHLERAGVWTRLASR